MSRARQTNSDGGALASGALKVERAAVRLHDAAHDRKSQAAATTFACARSLDTIEPLPQQRQMFRCDAFAGVGNAKNHAVIFGMRPQSDVALRRGVALRVLQKVHENARQVHQIGGEFQRLCGYRFQL